jgi:DNA-binding CsgD family transcriptional regulator
MAGNEVVARAAERRRLEELLAGLPPGGGGGAVIEGEPGAGKTVLLGEAVGLARARGLQVLAGGGRPAPSAGRSAWDAVRADVGLAGLIRRVAPPGPAAAPAVLALDDVQSAGPQAVAALAQLAHALPGLSLFVFCTASLHPRPSSLHQLIERLGAAGVERIRLGPLPDGEVTALAAGVAGAPPGPRLRRQLSWAGGNPRDVMELLGALLLDGAVGVRGGVAEIASMTLPPPLRTTILGRLGLPEEALDVLRVAAVLGSPFALGDLCRLFERRAALLLPPVRAAMAAGVLVEDDASLAFRQELLRQAFLHDLPAAVRAVLEDELGRKAGVTGGTAGRRRGERATCGWEALTETEVRVVGLVAEGLSNPEIAERMFISRRTVQTHVSHALAKVGLRSRVELATHATRRLR